MRSTHIVPALLLLAGCAMTPKTTPDNPPVSSQTAGWTFHVDPAVDSGGPLTVTARTEGSPETLTFRVTTLGNASRPLDDQTFYRMRELHYVLPAVDHDTYATLQVFPGPAKPPTGGANAPAAAPTPAQPGAAPEASPDAQPEPLFVWNVLLRPQSRSLLDYRGQADMPPPDDFDAYWERAKRELAAVPLESKVVRVPEKDTGTGLLHRVELPTVRDTTIVCWYYVPRGAFGPDGRVVRKCPVVIVMPGYGAEEPPIDRTDKGLITLSINPRNHGPSRDFWKSPVEHMTYNIEDPENYYYKLAYLDCLRGAQFVFSREEVDAKRVAAEGGSQGGLFAIALAALEPRIACVCSNVTAFSDYPDGMALARIGHHAGFRDRLAKATPEEADRVRLSLRYTDGANLVARVHAPIQIQMGGVDPVCPYPCGIVVYNNVPAGVAREFHVLPDAKHEVPGPMRENNMRWYRKYLGIE